MKRLAAALLLATAARASAAPSALYDRYCLACHGERGDGRGPAAAWLEPGPRDFTRGVYKWRSTPSGKRPLDADLARAIRAGAPGTAMPAFGGILDDAQVAALVTEVEAFAPGRFAGPPPAAIVAPPRPATLPDGREVYARLGCPACHGVEGRGDGPAATCPFDLTRLPPRGGPDLVRTLMTGVDGTTMPAFTGAATPAELWALAEHVRALRRGMDAPPPALGHGLAPPTGLRPPLQGDPPPSLPPAAASLSAEQCGRCHARQLAEWRGSIHASAVGPGLLGQTHDAAMGPCLPCHAPLAEQQTDATLRAQGVSCAGCHLAEGHMRRGPPRRADAALLPIPTYPFVADARYERSDVCLPCHQLAPDGALAGKPLLDTYREWLLGPYMPRGVQCQHCHMPERAHTWKGIHDPDSVRQGLRVTARRDAAGLHVTLENAGAGHMLPTTPTPAILVTAGGQTRRIGRAIEFTDAGFVEHEDTRLPPGASVTLDFPAADRVLVEVAPDAYYERFYSALLGRTPAGPARVELETALRRASSSRYVLYDLTASRLQPSR